MLESCCFARGIISEENEATVLLNSAQGYNRAGDQFLHRSVSGEKGALMGRQLQLKN